MVSFPNETVSVIIPVFNDEAFLRQAIDSVLAQTYRDLELIVVDDASTDGTPRIVEGYGEAVRFCRLEKNEGVAVARNTGLSLATGRYVAFLDSDDCWLPTKIEKQVACLKNHPTGFCFTAYERMDSEGKHIKANLPFRQQVDYRLLLKNTLIATSTVLIDRNRLGDFRMPLMRSGQDYACWLQLLRGKETALGLEEVLVRYRVGRKSLSSNKWSSIEQVWSIQTKQEGIPMVQAAFNTLCFCLNALKKR
jgi:teichuronic acid biosynthesis glycosyltransferase TuaG